LNKLYFNILSVWAIILFSLIFYVEISDIIYNLSIPVLITLGNKFYIKYFFNSIIQKNEKAQDKFIKKSNLILILSGLTDIIVYIIFYLI